MWPWEHLAFGYVWYSLGRRLRTGGGPSHREVLALAVGTQLPDLVDKPLAWEFGLLPSGVSLAHSIFVALPVTVAALAVARYRGAQSTGAAFGVGYLSHLAGDGLYYLLVQGEASINFVLWPFVPAGDGSDQLLVTVPRLWASFVRFLETPRGKLYLGLEVAFLAVAVGLWLWDGTPGIPRPGERAD
jgi:hypothetical protein